jgi:hypothetical protein
VTWVEVELIGMISYQPGDKKIHKPCLNCGAFALDFVADIPPVSSGGETGPLQRRVRAACPQCRSRFIYNTTTDTLTQD